MMNIGTATARHPNPHEDWELRVQDWVDGQADSAEAAAVALHLAECADCTALVEGLRAVDEQLLGTSPLTPTDSFDATLFARIDAEESERRRLREQALAQEPELAHAMLNRSLRKGLWTILATLTVALVVVGWALIAGPVGFSPASLVLKLASISPLQWLAIGAAAAAGTLGVARSVYS